MKKNGTTLFLLALVLVACGGEKSTTGDTSKISHRTHVGGACAAARSGAKPIAWREFAQSGRGRPPNAG
jgi:hypothetical protein